MNLADALLHHGRDEATALVADGVPTSYCELRAAVARAAGAWRSLGVRPGERAAIALADDADWVIAFLGAIRAGAVAVALNPRFAPADRDALAAEGRYAAWLGEDPALAPQGVATALSRDGWRSRVEAATPAATHVPGSASSPAFWLYSSGTTGLPKAVVHAHRVMPAAARCGIEFLGIGASDRLFAPSRLFFAYPLANSLFTGFACGATVILQREWPTVDNVVATAARDRPTVFFSVPAFYRALLHDGRARALAQGVRIAVSAGEAIAPALAAQWRRETGVPIRDGYGTSETLSLMLVGSPADGDATRAAPRAGRGGDRGAGGSGPLVPDLERGDRCARLLAAAGRRACGVRAGGLHARRQVRRGGRRMAVRGPLRHAGEGARPLGEPARRRGGHCRGGGPARCARSRSSPCATRMA